MLEIKGKIENAAGRVAPSGCRGRYRTARRTLLVALLLASSALGIPACLLDAPLPDLGPCAELPDLASYEYGQLGVGTCLASPADLRVRPDPQNPDNHFLFVVNSNSRGNFTGSSLLSIDASSIDLSCPVNGLHEVQSDALRMQEFAGRIDFEEATGLALVTNRNTGGYQGQLDDVVFTVDASNPRDLSFSEAGPRAWGPYRFIRVPADPWSVRINPSNGRAYVLGLTTHEVSALDLTSDPISFIDLRGESQTGDAVFEDVDASGSAPDFEVLGWRPALLGDETFSIRWMAGTTRLYYPVTNEDGSVSVASADSGNGADFTVLPGGSVLEPGTDWAADRLGAVSVQRQDDQLVALVTGRSLDGLEQIGSASAAEDALDWTLASSPSLEVTTGSWDEAGLRDPDFVRVDDDYRVYFAGGEGLGRALGHARGSSLANLAREGNDSLDGGDQGVILRPDPAGFDQVAVFAPSILRNGATGEYLLWYSGHSDLSELLGSTEVPSGLAIGLARSDDGVHFERTDRGIDASAVVLGPGEAGEWDSAGVAALSVLFADGRFQGWYHGYDGAVWRVGRATSIDGITWTRDPRNPVLEEPVALGPLSIPHRAYAWKASAGGSYRVDASIRGPRTDHAFEGVIYGECPDPERPVAGCTSPIQFRIVGGQALGRGAGDADDRDGASSPSGLDSGPVVYTAVGGSYRRLALARDLGAGASPRGRIPLSGFQGGLSGLNGDDPELPVREPELREDLLGNLVLGFETLGGIVLTTGELPLGKSEPEMQALGGGGFVVTAGGEESFDVDGVGSPSLVFDAADGGQRIYYQGTANERTRIGLVMSADGDTWVRQGEDGLVFDRGPAGAWDDASVSQPSVLWDSSSASFRMWYVGSDAATSRIGYAESVDGLAWTRHTDAEGVGAWVFDGAGLAFAQDGAFAPSVRKVDGGFEMWFEGRLDGVPRAGRALSADGITWVPVTNPTTAGDTFTIVTREGDDEVNTGIDLGDDRQHAIFVDGEVVHGAGASEMVLSPDGRYAVVANKRWLLPASAPAPGLIPIPAFLIGLDLHDDSDGDYVDANYNGIETLLEVPQRSDLVVGFRDMVFSEDGSELWVLQAPFVAPGDPGARSGPEALIRVDWSLVEENDVAEVVRDNVVTGYVPLAPGIERDPGYWTEVSVGPSSLALSSDGRRGYITNFNDNSLYIVDLQAGARGAVIDIISGLDENPWEVQLSPDEGLAYVINSYGVGRGPVQHSTLQVIDVDEDSPTYGRILTRLSNVESRSDHGCN